MKTIKVIGIALICSFAMMSCSSLDEWAESAPTEPKQDAIISAINATDNNVEGDFWTIMNFVDDFGDPTDEIYLKTKTDLSGVFSNSATTNSKLTARILIPYKKVQLKMNEYGSLPVKGSISKIRYKIIAKMADGTTEDWGSAWNYSDRIIFNSKQSKKIIIALASGKAFKLSLQENTPSEFASNSASYVVVIPQSVGFSTMFKKAFPASFPAVSTTKDLTVDNDKTIN